MRPFVALVVALVAVSGYSASSEGAQSTPSNSAGPVDDQYVTVVHAVLPSLERDKIITADHAICGGLDAKPDLGGYATMIQTAGQGSDVLKGRVMVDGAFGAYGPQHDDLRRQFAQRIES